MDQIESELRAALRRKPAPDGFGARLRARLSRAEAVPSARPSRRLAWPIWALAATLVLALGVGFIEHGRRVRERNRAALEQTLTALAIAATQLERAEGQAFSRWERLGDRLSEVPSRDRPRDPPGLVRSIDPRSRN